MYYQKPGNTFHSNQAEFVAERWAKPSDCCVTADDGMLLALRFTAAREGVKASAFWK